MKAVFALIIIYVGTFFVAIQGASNTPVQAAGQNSTATSKPAPANSIDPVKDADIRSLLELIGARDLIQEAANSATEQYRQKLASLAPNSDKAQDSINAYLAEYQKKYDPDALTDQLVAIYDKHYTEEEIKGLLQFFGSPLGQKTAIEMPKITKEVQLASRTLTNQAAREAWQQLRAQNPDASQGGRPFAGRRRLQQGQARGVSTQQAQAASQQP